MLDLFLWMPALIEVKRENLTVSPSSPLTSAAPHRMRMQRRRKRGSSSSSFFPRIGRTHIISLSSASSSVFRPAGGRARPVPPLAGGEKMLLLASREGCCRSSGGTDGRTDERTRWAKEREGKSRPKMRPECRAPVQVDAWGKESIAQSR